MTVSMSEPITGFSRDELLAAPSLHAQRRVVRFQEVDAAALIFYARVYDYFHDVYVEWLALHGVLLHEVVKGSEWVAPIRKASAEYLSPMRFGDPIVVSVVRACFDRGDLHVGYRIEAAGGRATAVGHTVHAVIDPTTFKRVDPPAAFRASVERGA